MSNIKSEEEIPQVAKELIKSLATENEFASYKLQKHNRPTKGDNFLGEVAIIDIIGTDKKGRQKRLSVIIKSAPQNECLRSQVPIELVYKREIYMYTVIFPRFKQFETSKALTPLSVTPKLYKESSLFRQETILLENLNEKGYRMLGRMKQLDAEHATLVLEQYAKLHALSFAMRDQNLTKFEEIVTPMDMLYLKFIKEGGFLATLSSNLNQALVSLNRDVDATAYEVFETFSNNLEDTLQEMNEPADNFSVVLHADGWVNNMLFKYDDAEYLDRPTGVKFIDYQLSGFGSPVLDVAYFFYINCDTSLLNRLDDFLRIYYNSLSSRLIQLESQPVEILYPYSILKEHWKRYAKFALVMACSLLRIKLSDENEAANLTQVAESEGNVGKAFVYDIANDNMYNELIRHLIMHFVENKLI